MKITLKKENLYETLLLAYKFTSTKFSSSPTLQSIFIEIKDKNIHFYSTNLNSYFHTRVKIKEDGEVKVMFDPKKMIDFLNLLPVGEIELEITDKEINITQGKTKGSFPHTASEDFPRPPIIKEKTQKIEAGYLTKNLPLVLFATSQDDGRPVLTGVNVVVADENLTLVATDGFRLSLLKLKQEISMSPALIPAEFLGEIIRQSKDEKQIEFAYLESEKMVFFRIGENEFYSRLIEGDFPPYERVIPADKKTSAVVDREELLRGVKLIGVFARDASNIIICEFKKSGLTIAPKTDIVNQNTTTIDCEFEGEEQQVAFNLKFLSDFLSSVSAKQVTIEVLRPDAPVAFRLSGNKDFLHIIMPVRIQK